VTNSASPLIETAGVEAVVASAYATGRAALDFEFLWERTYAPLACLAQMAVGDEVHLIDPVEGAPLAPIAAMVADPGFPVVMHAPSADLTLLGMQFGTVPSNLTDVQLVAGFVGLGAGQGLAALLDRVLKVRLDKGEQYTDWSKRPLSENQLTYAAADVENLFALSDELAARAERLGRSAWVAEEHARRYGPDSRWTPDPDESWRRVKGQGKLGPRDRAVLKAVAAWRENEAARRDKPTSWIVPDRTLLEIARRKPASRQALMNERGLPERMRPDDADALLDAIMAGKDAEGISLPASPPADVQARLEILAPLGQVLVAARAAEVDLAPTLLATRDEVESHLIATITGDSGRVSPLAAGWRYELAGSALEDLAGGRIALACAPTRPYLREIPPGQEIN
jgi:ribonuclease D